MTSRTQSSTSRVHLMCGPTQLNSIPSTVKQCRVLHFKNENWPPKSQKLHHFQKSTNIMVSWRGTCHHLTKQGYIWLPFQENLLSRGVSSKLLVLVYPLLGKEWWLVFQTLFLVLTAHLHCLACCKVVLFILKKLKTTRMLDMLWFWLVLNSPKVPNQKVG